VEEGGNICQVALLSSIIVELWPYGSVICEMSTFGNMYWSMDYTTFMGWFDIYPVNRRLGGSHSLSGRFEVQNNLSPTGIQTLNRLARSLVAIPPEIFRLLL